MTAAIIALSVLAAGLGAALVWAIREARGESELAIAAAKQALTAAGAQAAAERERDEALAAAKQATAERDEARTTLANTEALLAAAREEIADALIHAVKDADPADLPAVVDQLLLGRLQTRARRTEAAGADRGPAPADAVPGPGPATDGPRPAWADLAGG